MMFKGNCILYQFHKPRASKHLGGRKAIVPMEGIFGGGASINFMMYTRAQGIDLHSWKYEGWAAEDIFPLCNKLETYHPTGPGIDRSKHRRDAPIHISDGGFRAKKSEDQFVDAVTKMGYDTIEDLQDLEANRDGHISAPLAKFRCTPALFIFVFAKEFLMVQPTLSHFSLSSNCNLFTFW